MEHKNYFSCSKKKGIKEKEKKKNSNDEKSNKKLERERKALLQDIYSRSRIATISKYFLIFKFSLYEMFFQIAL